MRLLLKKEVDTKARNINRFIILIEVVIIEYKIIVRLLLEKEVDVYTKNISGNIVLTKVAKKGYKTII